MRDWVALGLLLGSPEMVDQKRIQGAQEPREPRVNKGAQGARGSPGEYRESPGQNITFGCIRMSLKVRVLRGASDAEK